VRLEEGSEESLLEKLVEHDIDLLISDRKPEVKKDRRLVFKELHEIEYFFGAHSQLKFETFEQAVNDGSFVFRLPYDPGLDIYEAQVSQQKGNLRILAELHDAEIHQRLIKAGKAVGAVPDSAFKESKDLVKLSRKHAFKETLWMVSARRKLQNPIAQKVWNHFQISDKVL
jgi:DNA-binding transcriptional LysR family regulator